MQKQFEHEDLKEVYEGWYNDIPTQEFISYLKSLEMNVYLSYPTMDAEGKVRNDGEIRAIKKVFEILNSMRGKEDDQN